MLPYQSMQEAAADLGRALTTMESVWFWYSARMPDWVLYMHIYFLLNVVFTLAPLPLVLLELNSFKLIQEYKIQPKIRLRPSDFLRCYVRVVKLLFFAIIPVQLASFPAIKFMGIRTSLPLPSLWEACSQLLVYFLVDDYVNYWLHRMLHSKWLYENIHRVHHEFTAPIGFAAPYAHWAEVLIVGSPSLIGPALAPGHMVTLWAWIILRQLEAIDTHIGYKFPFTPTKYIPFYGGAEFHDYHHNVGGQSRSNFASIFTYCDYIYRTNKGYRYHRAYTQKSKRP
ncbi:very-long-chain aldehyde decarbonylase GL1-10-like [Wolffia australiana]